ncbi:MAG: cytochrome c [Moorea sp. SIO2B7]|nr:cytochrome c [Moorena sp. SIO2B7]
MENQIAKPKVLTGGITLMSIAVLLLIFAMIMGLYFYRMSDPYIQEVLSLQGDEVRGHAIYQINCSGCHGLQADGSIGPSLQHIPQRKSKVRIINQVISGKTPPMPKFKPISQDMADLLSYLEKL